MKCSSLPQAVASGACRSLLHLCLMTPAAPPAHVADRLLAAIDSMRAPVCVGIDPVVEKLPHVLRPNDDSAASIVSAIRAFCEQLIEAVIPYVPCIKFQSACFERYGSVGVSALEQLMASAGRHADLQVILDAKRGDIGISADQYAAAAFQPTVKQSTHATPDWLTIKSYLGSDGIEPFLKHERHGAFALVRTSNPGGDAIQNLVLRDGRTVAQAVGDLIAQIGSRYVGSRGYSTLGAVVGATKSEDVMKLRRIMPQQIFLVPGYGAQGGGVEDVLPCFNSDGAGALVTASRSVMYAFTPNDARWNESVANAAAKFADEVGSAVGKR